MDIELRIYERLKYIVSVNGLAKFYIKKGGFLITEEDLVHDVWLYMIEGGYHNKYDPERTSLNTYISYHLEWYLLNKIDPKRGTKFNRMKKVRFVDYPIEEMPDKSPDAEEIVVMKELDNIIRDLDYGGEENKRYIEGESQADMAKELGMTRAGVSAHVKKQQEKLKKKVALTYNPFKKIDKEDK